MFNIFGKIENFIFKSIREDHINNKLLNNELLSYKIKSEMAMDPDNIQIWIISGCPWIRTDMYIFQNRSDIDGLIKLLEITKIFFVYFIVSNLIFNKKNHRKFILIIITLLQNNYL